MHTVTYMDFGRLCCNMSDLLRQRSMFAGYER